MTPFDHEAVMIFDRGSERLQAETLQRVARVDWTHVGTLYRMLKPGQGFLYNGTLNTSKAAIVNAFTRRGLTCERDYEVFLSYVDAAGNRLPKGNWLQYIKRLSEEDPTL